MVVWQHPLFVVFHVNLLPEKHVHRLSISYIYTIHWRIYNYVCSIWGTYASFSGLNSCNNQTCGQYTPLFEITGDMSTLYKSDQSLQWDWGELSQAAAHFLWRKWVILFLSNPCLFDWLMIAYIALFSALEQTHCARMWCYIQSD